MPRRRHISQFSSSVCSGFVTGCYSGLWFLRRTNPRGTSTGEMRDGRPLHPNFFDDGLSEPECSPAYTQCAETLTSVHRNILTGAENRRRSSLSRCLKTRKPKPLSPRPATPPAAIVPASCRRPCGSRSQQRTANRLHSPPALTGSYRGFDRNEFRPLRFSLPQVALRTKKTTCESENLPGPKKWQG